MSTVNYIVYCKLGRMRLEREYRIVKYSIKVLCNENLHIKKLL